MSPGEQDFNWVKARHECSFSVEFSRLHLSAKENVEERNKNLPPESAVDFSFHNDSENHFEVHRTPALGLVGKRYEVIFLRRNDHILIRNSFLNKNHTLTLTLNNDGECRFKVDGEGEYKRWQVLRMALEPIFFTNPR